MVRKKWIAREDVSAARDAARLVKVAVLRGAEERNPVETRLAASLLAEAEASTDGPQARHHTTSPKKLNENQQTLIEALTAAGGRVTVEDLRGLMSRALRWARWYGGG